MSPPRQTLPLLPLPAGMVLLPGVTLRVPIADRADILPLLGHVFNEAKNVRKSISEQEPRSAIVGCVHVRPASKDQDHQSVTSSTNVPLEQRIKQDFSEFGTTAKVIGLDQPILGGLSLVVEGLRRFRLVSITRVKPFFEGAVKVHGGDGRSSCLSMI